MIANDSNAHLKVGMDHGHWLQTLTFVIHDATRKDNGEYACALENIPGIEDKIWSNSIEIKVIGMVLCVLI